MMDLTYIVELDIILNSSRRFQLGLGSQYEVKFRVSSEYNRGIIDEEY